MMDSVKPRIIMVIKDLQAVGGAQLNAIRLAKQLHDMGYDIALIGYGTSQTIRKHLSRFNINFDIPIYPVSPPPKGWISKIIKYWPNIFFVVPCLLNLWKLRERFDVLHGPLLMESGLICALTSIILGKPSLVKLGSAGRYGDVRRALQVALSNVRRTFFRHITKFVCLTSEIEKELISELNIPVYKLIRIPNGVDLNTFKPVTREQKSRIRKNLGFNTNAKIILFVGRLELKKRVEFLLKAWGKVQETTDKNANLIIVGDGSLRGKLQDFQNKLEIGKTVTFYGESANVGPIMQAADIFVLPSVSEGLANVFLESMASALPVIATNTNGNSEVLKHNENALLFEEENIQELSDSILYLLKHEDFAKTLGNNARRSVEVHFDLNNVVQQYDKLYEELS